MGGPHQWGRQGGRPDPYQPQYGQQPQFGQQPQYGHQLQYRQQPQFGQQPFGGQPQFGQYPQPPRRSRTGLWLGLGGAAMAATIVVAGAAIWALNQDDDGGRKQKNADGIRAWATEAEEAITSGVGYETLFCQAMIDDNRVLEEGKGLMEKIESDGDYGDLSGATARYSLEVVDIDIDGDTATGTVVEAVAISGVDSDVEEEIEDAWRNVDEGYTFAWEGGKWKSCPQE